jgi:glutaconate CoA-transferase subunit B
VVPRVILFRTEHSRRTLVPKVDFISAPGTSAPNVYRRGGPVALVTPLCHFSFDKQRSRFRLETVHPGHTVEEVLDSTGFDFDRPAAVPVTPEPQPATLRLLRETLAPELAALYPQFGARVFGIVPRAAE